MNRIILITTFTCVQQEGRLKEWDDCVRINAENPHIDEIIAFVHTTPERGPEDVFPALKHEKARWIAYQPMPTFGYLFNYAAENHAGDYCVIANGDIYFEPDSNIQRLREIQARHLWLLSRYDLVKGRWIKIRRWVNRMIGASNDARESYDAFGFLSPLPDFEPDIIIGKVDSDSYLRQKAQRSGIPVLNPSKTIIGKHKDFVLTKDKQQRPSRWIENNERYSDKADYNPHCKDNKDNNGSLPPAFCSADKFRE